jgi:DNA-binding NarL/FixJ family response regulator
VSVVLADEEPVVRRGLAAVLAGSAAIAVVGEAATAREAVRVAALHRPDVLVLDTDLPGGGVDTVREVLRVTPHTAVLAFTAADDEDTVVGAVRAGARGYLLKDSGGDGVVRAVTGLGRGETIFGPGVADRLLDRIGSRTVQEVFPQLTGREQDVLELVAAGLGNSAIASRLRLSPKTIANLVSVILGKLHVASRAEAVELVKGRRRAPLELVHSVPRSFHRPLSLSAHRGSAVMAYS